MALWIILLILGSLKPGTASWVQPAQRRPLCAPPLEIQWRRYNQKLASIQINGQPITSSLQGVLEHEYTLSRPQAERGLAFKGSNARLKQLVQSMLDNKPSVAIGLLAGPNSCPGQNTTGAEEVIPGSHWVRRFAAYLQTAFPDTQFTVKHVCYGHIQPIKDASTCILEDIPKPVDLVLIELTAPYPLQNNFYHNVVSKEFELLLRRALTHGDAPAVVAIQALRAAQVYPQPGGPHKDSYTTTYEDLLSAAAQYYDVPWLSLRDALWLDVDPDAQSQPQTTHDNQLGAEQAISGDTHTSDDVRHVIQREGAAAGKLACRWRSMHADLSKLPGWASVLAAPDANLTDLGHRMMSDLLVWLIQQAAVEQQLHPVDSLAQRYFVGISSLPQPVFPGNLETRVTSCSARVLPISEALKAVLLQGVQQARLQAQQQAV